MKRIGIYTGAFDPVHAGHIAFALQAMKTARLGRIYFLPERQPRGKVGAEHFGHRVAMLKRALRPYRYFKVLEPVEVNFSVHRTLPGLQRRFAGAQLVFLVGSDVAHELPHWPQADVLLARAELVVGLRGNDTAETVQVSASDWPVVPRELHIVQSFAPDVSSSQIRRALYSRRPVKGLLSSVERYSSSQWLYVSLA